MENQTDCERQPKDIIKKPLKIDTEKIIQKLKILKHMQYLPYEEIITNSFKISKLLKSQQEIEKRGKYLSISNDQSEIQQNLNQEYKYSIESENFEQKNIIQQLENKVQQLERETKNLREETALKTEVFQNELSQRFTDSKSMPFTRITIPRLVQQYFYVQDQDILVQCEKDEPIPLLKLYNIEKRMLANNIYSNSVGQSFSNFSVFGDKLIWCTENSTEIEIWTFKQPPEPLKRIGIIPAHTDTITYLQLISSNIILSSSQKGIIKMWKIDSQQLIKSFRFNSNITYSQVLKYRVITNLNQNNNSEEYYQIIAGFSDGSIKILEFSLIQKDQQKIFKYDVIYEININQQNLKDAGVDCISVAYHKDKKVITDNKISLDSITIAASITSEPNNIYIVVPEKKKTFNIMEFTKKIYRNSSNKKQFTLTEDYLIAGSFDGQIFVWEVKNLLHPLRANSPSITLKLSSHTLSAVPILMAVYDQSKDILVTGDEQGNVLKWENFIQNVDKK
ncbi:WD domain, G-beta repeat protein (macronuclear) [Tetrahymena thermophila SB210]|uniref:WD domain, G-beta repeat protein n=1 Tax=Tetrahymena thermophila (strain SB210) TaxID=312017 RepID=Q22FX9_TETTS|nr:WD domain, G-beta repeat protein [Tetrahymena thermophila SB210]EAR84247.1 WD domain, G-beta repeat protein [Tetrahymena thermophila SB210]|eukprot:XP_001031910.1 WD domain, G-beta repeat protein [Tetrahymena thermophila SB210]